MSGILTKSNNPAMHNATQFPPHFSHLSSLWFFCVAFLRLSSPPAPVVLHHLCLRKPPAVSWALLLSSYLKACLPCDGTFHHFLSPATHNPRLFTTLFKFPAFSSSSPLFQLFQTLSTIIFFLLLSSVASFFHFTLKIS